MARTPRNQNSKSPATTNVGEMFVAIASHEIEATPQEVNAADLFQQSLTKAHNEQTRRNRASQERQYQKGNIIVQYAYDGTPETIFLACEAMNDNTKEMIFGACSDLRKIPFFLCNVSGLDLKKSFFNRDTLQVEKVKQRTFQIG